MTDLAQTIAGQLMISGPQGMTLDDVAGVIRQGYAAREQAVRELLKVWRQYYPGETPIQEAVERIEQVFDPEEPRIHLAGLGVDYKWETNEQLARQLVAAHIAEVNAYLALTENTVGEAFFDDCKTRGIEASESAFTDFVQNSCTLTVHESTKVINQVVETKDLET